MRAEPEHHVVVADRNDTADGVTVLELVSPDGTELPDWAPGAHVDLVGADGECRQYSLCGRVGDRSTLRIAVLREEGGRGFSKHVHDTALPGTRWRVRGPRSHFELVPSERYLFIGGGIGITPLLPMLAQAEAAGATWDLLYGGRSRASMAFLDELEEWGDRVHVYPQDEVGLLPLGEWLGEPREGVAVYCCGPEPLLKAVEEFCDAWPHGSLHTERFHAAEPLVTDDDTAFEVELAGRDTTLLVPAGKSILQVLAENGVPTVSSCQEGTCGSCETAVVEGVPDHRDSVLDEDERAANDYMMICVSRSCGPRLVLDLDA